jgi:hypothetical protein
LTRPEWTSTEQTDANVGRSDQRRLFLSNSWKDKTPQI